MFHPLVSTTELHNAEYNCFVGGNGSDDKGESECVGLKTVGDNVITL